MANLYLRELPLAEVVAGRNDRTYFDPADIESLAASIAAHGLAQPITARFIFYLAETDERIPVVGYPKPPAGAVPMYEIVAGERRFKAFGLLGRATIPAMVGQIDNEAAAAIMLAENTGRIDLNPIEEALAYRARIEMYGWTYEKVAQAAGVAVATVGRRLRLLDLHQDIKHLVARRQFPLRYAELTAGLDGYRQLIALRAYQAKPLSLDSYKQIVSTLQAQQSESMLFDIDTFFTGLAHADAPKQPTELDVPARADLPELRRHKSEPATHMIRRYITDLESAGYRTEAATIGTLYKALIASNAMALPSL